MYICIERGSGGLPEANAGPASSAAPGPGALWLAAGQSPRLGPQAATVQHTSRDRVE